MLQYIKELYGYELAASDGAIGRVKDFYFDDKTWAVRYLVAETGSWLSERQVLLSPRAFGHLDRDRKLLAVTLTRKQIENSPSIQTHQPVSRQYEIDYYRYYGWPTYWSGDPMQALGCYPAVIPPSGDEIKALLHQHSHDDLHLRSTKAVDGYQIHASDGVIGSVSGFMVDNHGWLITELVVEAGHWYSGRRIVIPTARVVRISYEESTVFVNLTKDDIRGTGENENAMVGGRAPDAQANLH